MEISNELRIEKELRKYPWLIPAITFLVIAILFTGIVFCHIAFVRGYHLAVLPAAILAHAYFIVIIHDGCHKAITKTQADYFIMNFFGGLMLFPFHPEAFRKYHLTHHAQMNNEQDPNWTPLKATLFKKNRFLYVLCQLIPILFTLAGLLIAGKQIKSPKVKGPGIRWKYMLFSVLVSVAVVYFLRPSPWFVLSSLFFLNFLDALRHWCEHMGTARDLDSNTYWFPLGMGVGNHDAHHENPKLSWLSLAVGLRSRKKQTDPFRTLWGILFVRDFRHYSENKENKRI